MVLAATVPKDRPTASVMENPASSISNGTANTEPPAPVSPSTKPISTPINTKVTIGSRSRSALLFIPGRVGEQPAHKTQVGHAGEHQTGTRKSRQTVKRRVYPGAQSDTSQHQHTGD